MGPKKSDVFSALESINDLDSSKDWAVASLLKTSNLNPWKYRKQVCLEHLSVAAAQDSLQSEVEVILIIWVLESPKMPPDRDSALKEPYDFLKATPIFAHLCIAGENDSSHQLCIFQAASSALKQNKLQRTQQA